MFQEELKTVIANSKQRKDSRKFGVTIGIFFIFIAVILFWKQNDFAYYLLGGGLFFSLLSVTITFLLRPVYIIWMSIAVILGFFMTRLILTLFFSLIITPVGLAIKLLGKDLLKEKVDSEADTYWLKREKKVFDIKSLENQY